MFKAYDETHDRDLTIDENNSTFLFRHNLIIEEHIILSDQHEAICDAQREWMNKNAVGLDYTDKKNYAWLNTALAAHTKIEIIPNMKITWDDYSMA